MFGLLPLLPPSAAGSYELYTPRIMKNWTQQSALQIAPSGEETTIRTASFCALVVAPPTLAVSFPSPGKLGADPLLLPSRAQRRRRHGPQTRPGRAGARARSFELTRREGSTGDAGAGRPAKSPSRAERKIQPPGRKGGGRSAASAAPSPSAPTTRGRRNQRVCVLPRKVGNAPPVTHKTSQTATIELFGGGGNH